MSSGLKHARVKHTPHGDKRLGCCKQVPVEAYRFNYTERVTALLVYTKKKKKKKMKKIYASWRKSPPKIADTSIWKLTPAELKWYMRTRDYGLGERKRPGLRQFHPVMLIRWPFWIEFMKKNKKKYHKRPQSSALIPRCYTILASDWSEYYWSIDHL